MKIRKYILYLTIFMGIAFAAVFLSAKSAQATDLPFSCIDTSFSDQACGTATQAFLFCRATNAGEIACLSFGSGGSFRSACGTPCLLGCDHTTGLCASPPAPTPAPGSCSGNINISLIQPNPANVGDIVQVTVNGLTDCNGNTVLFKAGSCDPFTFASCTVVGGTGCTGAFSAASAFNLFACIDKNGSNGFNDFGEQHNKGFAIVGAPTVVPPTATPTPPTATPPPGATATPAPPTTTPGGPTATPAPIPTSGPTPTAGPTATPGPTSTPAPPTPTPVHGYWGEADCVRDGVATLDCVPAVIKLVIQSLLLFAGIVAIFLIIHSGSKFVLSSGDPKKVEEARNTLVYAIMGLIIVLAAFLIVNLVSHLTGVVCLRNIGFLCI